jgi:hypothetical protein
MKEFIWRWFFWASVVFFSLLSVSSIAAYALYNTAPDNAYTQVFASGFGFVLGFIGLAFVNVYLFDKLNTTPIIFRESDNEIFNRVIQEAPFFFFALLFFFSIVLYMGIYLLVLSYVKNACL